MESMQFIKGYARVWNFQALFSDWGVGTSKAKAGGIRSTDDSLVWLRAAMYPRVGDANFSATTTPNAPLIRPLFVAITEWWFLAYLRTMNVTHMKKDSNGKTIRATADMEFVEYVPNVI